MLGPLPAQELAICRGLSSIDHKYWSPQHWDGRGCRIGRSGFVYNDWLCIEFNKFLVDTWAPPLCTVLDFTNFHFTSPKKSKTSWSFTSQNKLQTCPGMSHFFFCPLYICELYHVSVHSLFFLTSLVSHFFFPPLYICELYHVSVQSLFFLTSLGNLKCAGVYSLFTHPHPNPQKGRVKWRPESFVTRLRVERFESVKGECVI